MLKTLGSTESATQPREGVVGVRSNSRTGREESKLDKSKLNGGKVDCNEVEDDKVGKKVQKLSKSKKTVGSSDFFTFGAKLAFTKLRQAFLKASILYHFNPKCHIWIKTDISGYTIGEVLNQLTSNDLGQ